MKFIANLKGYKKYFDMEAVISNKKGEILDSVTIEEAKKNIKFNIKKSDALLGKKKSKLTISFEDTNGDAANLQKKKSNQFDLDPDDQDYTATLKKKGKKGKTNITLSGSKIDSDQPSPPDNETDTDPPNFTSAATASIDENVDAGSTIYLASATDSSDPLSFSLSGSDASSFTITPLTNFTANVTINSSPDFETKSSYSFNVVAVDAVGNSSTQAVTLSVNDLEEGQTLDLTVGLDNIQASNLSSKDDVINGELGTLGNGFLDTVVDGSTTDNDTLKLKTNGTFSFDRSLGSFRITRIQNIENLHVTADNDVAVAFGTDLDKVVNLKKLTVDGTFTTNPFRLIDWASTGATEFDYSGITSTLGTQLLNADAGNQAFAGNIVFKGSAGADTFEGILGNVTMKGGSGGDTLTGSTQGVSSIHGGAGTDTIDLLAHNAQHTISLQRQTSQTSKDTVTNFQGFNNTTAFNTNSFDLIEIDAATFSNYTAGKPQQQDRANITAGVTNLSNTVVIAPLEAQLSLVTGDNFDNNGDGILGFAVDTGTLIYSASGNFSADAQELLEIGAAEGANFVPTQQINVV